MNEKKTILYIGGFELPDKNAAAQRVLANAKIFRELGFNVILVGIDKTLDIDSNIESTRKEVSKFDTWSIPYPESKKSWLKYITTYNYLENLIDTYYSSDLYAVIGYNYPAIAQIRIQKMCRDKEALFIADSTEWYESSGSGILFNTIKWFDTMLRMSFVNPMSSGIITVSKYLTNYYQKKNCLTLHLPTLYDNNAIQSSSKTMKKNSDIVNIMYAGSAFNLNRVNKNRTNIKDRLDKIILIFSRVFENKQNFLLNIYGLEVDNYLSVFPEHKDILENLSEHIVFHGRQAHVDIVKRIQESDFTIFLRNIERVIVAGFPSKFSESISYGTPVISNLISNIEDYIEEGENSYIISLDDEEEQVRKMISILNLSKEDRNTMKEYCMANKIFNYQNYAEKVNIFLQKLDENSNK